VAEHVCTLVPLEHCAAPGTHAAQSPAPRQYGVAVPQGTGDDQTPAAVHVTTASC
jgi:hypothetical protein